ncbi:hypothetical protein [Hyphomonas sp.]|uniref:hypothetical protein n=1 Tax=Hyphomonas sp. TaxID=87 RepID=UPI00391A84B8
MSFHEPDAPDHTRIKSAAIRWIVDRAITRGVGLASLADWTKALVAHMDAPLAPDFRAEIEAAWPGLAYFADHGAPHNAPDEGYIEDRFAVSFPRPRPAIKGELAK